MIITEQISFTHPAGLHARPSSQLAMLAKKFTSNIYIAKNGEKVNIKDILSVLSLGITPGIVHVEADGADAKEAMQAVRELFKTDFSDFN